MNAQQIIDSARETLLDDGTFWPTTELLGYVNEAQAEIVSIRPTACVKTESVALNAGARQSMPSGARRLIDIMRNESGAAITAVDQRDLDQMAPGWPQATATKTIEHYCYDERASDVFYVYPPAASGARVEMSYAASVDDVTSAGHAISIDDSYRAALVEYVLYRAHSKDTQAAVPQRAQAHYQQFAQMIGLQRQSERRISAGEPDPNNPRELR
ncbi:DUF6682 family protein [Salinisphaera sp. SPP-AMP-43]|uniref:phage adaptor protein n=1 Tax=Salinisphaera sp. SPP-AMP-43 TaxID=3121288 RepID=UPI003C6E1BF1